MNLFKHLQTIVHTELCEIYAVLEIIHSWIVAQIPEHCEHKGDNDQEAEHYNPGYLQQICDNHKLQCVNNS